MPQPNRKRGKRGDGNKKRKLQDDIDDIVLSDDSSKRRRRKSGAVEDGDDQAAGLGIDSTEVAVANGDYDSHRELGDGQPDRYGDESNQIPFETAYFGVLDEQEQAYFHNADNVLDNDAFADPSERSLFLSNVYKEADGKELKIAQSQSCSRLLERLIRLSTPAQLRRLFQKFSGK